MTDPTGPSRPYVRQVAEHHQMGSGNEASNGVTFVPARSHSGTVTLTTLSCKIGCKRLVSSSARVGGPCGRTGSFHQECDLLEHVRDVYRAPLAFGKLNPRLTRSVARAR